MHSMTNRLGFATRLVAAMLVILSAAAGAPAEMMFAVGNPVELTKEDLFSLPDWKERNVSVDDFVLGMTREQAFEVAKVKGLKLRSDQPPRKLGQVKLPCHESSCSVSQINGNWIGINLLFDAERLVRIKVSVPIDAYPEVKKVNIARQFKGRTYEFFNNYSDDLRKQIFGRAEEKDTPIKAGAQISNLVQIEYGYLSSGVTIHVTIDKNEHPPKPFDLEVDFVRHP
jgi:hypothetical protein